MQIVQKLKLFHLGENGFNSRNDLINFAEKYQIKIPKDKRGEAHLVLMQIYFTLLQKVKFLKTHGLMHLNMYIQEQSLLKMQILTPDEIIISFEQGDPVSINQKN